MRGLGPYRIRKGGLIILLAMAPLLYLVKAIGATYGGSTSPPSLVRFVGLQYCLTAMVASLVWPPRSHGRRAGADMVMRMHPWRRTAAASGLPVALLIGEAEHVLRGEISLGAVAGSLAVMVVWFVATADRIAVSTDRIQRVGGIGPRHSIPWSTIRGLEIWSAGLRIRGEGGRSIHVPGVLLDGYPEFVAMLLKRAPKELLSPLGSDVREMLMVIADLADPRGAADRGGEYPRA